MQRFIIKMLAVSSLALSFGSFGGIAHAKNPSAVDNYTMMMKARTEMMRVHTEMVRAHSDALRARAEARKAYYEAEKLRQSARMMSMDGQLKRVDTYFQKKLLRAEYKRSLNAPRRVSPHLSPSANSTAMNLPMTSRK